MASNSRNFPDSTFQVLGLQAWTTRLSSYFEIITSLALKQKASCPHKFNQILYSEEAECLLSSGTHTGRNWQRLRRTDGWCLVGVVLTLCQMPKILTNVDERGNASRLLSYEYCVHFPWLLSQTALSSVTWGSVYQNHSAPVVRCLTFIGNVPS